MLDLRCRRRPEAKLCNKLSKANKKALEFISLFFDKGNLKEKLTRIKNLYGNNVNLSRVKCFNYQGENVLIAWVNCQTFYGKNVKLTRVECQTCKGETSNLQR